MGKRGRPPKAPDSFSPSELRILWYLKRHGGKITAADQHGSLYVRLSDDLGLARNTVRGALRDLERACVVIRHFARPISKFGDGGGGNPLMGLELVDPRMWLPPEPQISLGVRVAIENRELEERTAHEPEMVQMLDALVDRCLELQTQIDKLQELVVKLNEDNEKLRKQSQRTPPPDHLTSRIKDVLTPEQWEAMRHSAQ